MKKKILIGSILAVALLTLVSFSSVVGYQSVVSDLDISVEENNEVVYQEESSEEDCGCEEKAEELMERISIDKKEYADELDIILKNDDELRERIYTLYKMYNEDISIPLGWEDTPIICLMIAAMLGSSMMMGMTVVYIYNLLNENGYQNISNLILIIYYSFFIPILMIPVYLWFEYCWIPYP
jgi:hypothetical protein